LQLGSASVDVVNSDALQSRDNIAARFEIEIVCGERSVFAVYWTKYNIREVTRDDYALYVYLAQ
jgi:hypothetical protein